MIMNEQATMKSNNAVKHLNKAQQLYSTTFTNYNIYTVQL